MKYTALFILMCSTLQAQVFKSLQTGSSAATTTLSNYPLGNYQWAFRIHGLPSTAPGSDITLVNIAEGSSYNQLCKIPAGTLTIVCYDQHDGGPDDGALNYPSFAGMTDIRMIVRRYKDATNGTLQEDLWAADCTGHQGKVSRALYQSGEGTTTSGTFSIGSSNTAIAFFRSDTLISPPRYTKVSCPADAPTAISSNIDFRFEGGTYTDVSGNNYTLSGSGLSIIDSPLARAAIIGGWSGPLPVIRANTATAITGINSIPSNGGGITAYSWSSTGSCASYSLPSSAATNITIANEGQCTISLQITDSNGSSTTNVDVGSVATNSSGVKTPTGDMGLVLGPVTRHGVNPFPWYEHAEYLDADWLKIAQTYPPRPKTIFVGTGVNDGYFGGTYTAGNNATYCVKITSTGTPNQFSWGTNYPSCNNGATGVSISAAGTTTYITCYGGIRDTPGVADLPLQDGVTIKFATTTGHTLNDIWFTGPATGTAAITQPGGPYTTIYATGTGTHWATGDATQTFAPGDNSWIEWDADGGGSHTGRAWAIISTVTDDTHMTINMFNPSLSLATSVWIQKPSVDIAAFGGCQGPSSLNFYEGGALAIYRLFERTELSKYQAQARATALNWWIYGIDHGYWYVDPKYAGWQGIMAALVDGQSLAGGWDALANNVSRNAQINPTNPVTRDHGYDVRETSYVTRATALMARLYPQHTGNPSSTRTTWCGYLINQTNNYWLQSTDRWTLINGGVDGYWQENLCGQDHCGYPVAGNPPGPQASARFGTSPWRANGLSNLALIEAYAALNDSNVCNNPTLAASVKTAIEKSGNFIWDIGRSSDGGLHYNVEYSSLQGTYVNTVLHNRPDKFDGEALSVTNGSTAVSCNNSAWGCYFTRRFAPCDGRASVVIKDSGGTQRTYTVTGCADNNHITLGSAYGGATETIYQGGWWSPSSITVTNGSYTITGTNTNFTGLYSPCNGTTYIGINTGDIDTRGVYKITACPDDTHITLSAAFSGTGATITDYEFSQQSNSNCSPGTGTQCENDPWSGKNLSHDAAASMGWLYSQTGNSTWKDRLEYMLGKMYGGPDTGPGTYGTSSGPQTDGTANNFDSILPSCLWNVMPCSWQGGMGDQLAKPFGMSAGAGNAPNAIAYYYGPNPCVDLSFNPTSATPGYGGGSGTVTVSVTDQSCLWTATSNQGWLTVTNGSGTGNGSFNWSVSSNGGSQRVGTVSSNSAVLTVTQAGIPINTPSIILRDISIGGITIK